MAHSPCQKQQTHCQHVLLFYKLSFFQIYILGLDSCNAGSLSPGPAGAAGRPLLPPLAGRRRGSFSPRDSDARLSTSPAGSSGCGPRQHPPMGIMILKTAALQLAKNT